MEYLQMNVSDSKRCHSLKGRGRFSVPKKEWEMDRKEIKAIHVGCLAFSGKWLQETEKRSRVTAAPLFFLWPTLLIQAFFFLNLP